MSSFRTHRVVIASLFLPETVCLGEGSETSTPTITKPELSAPSSGPTTGPGATPQRLLSGASSPRLQISKPPTFARQFSTPAPPPRSIVQDLTDKSRGNTPAVAHSPGQEIANPFSTLNPLAAAVHALGDGPARRSPQGPERLQPRVRRASRSSSRRPGIERTMSNGESKTKWHLESNPRCNGGLYNAVNSVHDRLRRKLWVGVLGTSTDSFDEELRTDVDRRMRIEAQSLPVWIPDDEFSKCYDGFCHQVLWPYLHYAVPDAPKTKSFYESETWAKYCSVNQKFANAIVANYEDGDIIWVNDYHLMLVPSMVREKLPNAAIGFFMHVAFPSSEIFRCLTIREQLLRGLLAADLVGFQTANFARHFRQTVSRILTLESVPKGIQTESRFVDVAVFPMGIDVKALNIRRRDPEVAEWVKHLQDRYAGLKMIVGRDKLDEIAGMRHKLKAFEAFLEKYPDFQGKVVLIQVALSTTMENELQGNVVDLVGRINSKFSTLTYQPIVFLHTDEVTFSQYLALLTAADAFLVTSLREGMALRTHEYVVCQEGRARPSPLILSEFTGSYSYSGFRACLPVNPWDTRMTANAIYAALTMSDTEARSRWKDLHAHVITQTAQAFVSAFLTRCLRVHLEHEKAAENTEDDAGAGRAPPLDIERVLPRYRHAYKRLLLIDFEGTIWLRDPCSQEFNPPQDALDVLDALSKDNRNEVWLLSGLPRAGGLEKIAEQVPTIGLVAENGCFLKPRAINGQHQPWINTVANFNLSWKAPCLEMLQYFSERTPGSLVEEREASIVWRFWTNQSESVAERQWARRQAAEAQNHIFDSLGEKYSLRIIPGQNAFLVLPNNVSRSSAVGAILAPGGPVRFTSTHSSLPHSIWSSMSIEADAYPSYTYGSGQLDPEGDLGIEFVFAVSGDEKLLRRLNELECAETVSSGSRGEGSGVGTDAKWTIEPREVCRVLGEFATVR